MCRVSSKIGASSRRTCRSATESLPPETATRTVSPPVSIPWWRMVRSTVWARPTLASLQPHPDFAVLEVLLLPHRDGALERVDRVAARVEGVAPMRSGHGDEHRGLADLEPADAVQDGHALDLGPARADRLPDLAELGLGHRRVRLVLEELHRSPARLVAYDAREEHHAAGAGIVDQRGQRLGRERVVDDLEYVVADAAAHRREQAELIVGAEVMLGLDVVVSHREEG